MLKECKKVREALRRQSMRLSIAAMTAGAAMLPMASASNDGGAGATSVVSIITSAAENLKSEAMSVISVAVGIGVVFWGARVLWSKFKSMAK